MRQVGKVPDSFLISAIGRANKIDIDNPQALSQRGVSKDVIDALMKRKAELAFAAEPAVPAPAAPVTNQSAAPAAPPAGAACPERDGVYFNSSSGWTGMEAAPVGEMSMKGMNPVTSNPFGKKTVGQRLDGLEAPTKTGLKPEFCLSGSYASSARAVQLVKLEKRKDHRELVESSFGMFRPTKMNQLDKLPDGLKVEKIGENLLVSVNGINEGEYALRISGQVFDFSARQ
jgi:hypothetical protein